MNIYYRIWKHWTITLKQLFAQGFGNIIKLSPWHHFQGFPNNIYFALDE